MELNMTDKILKIIDYIIYTLIAVSVVSFFYGMYEIVDLIFIRGKLW